MADVDVGTIYDEVTTAENTGSLVVLNAVVVESVNIVESVLKALDVFPSVHEAVTVAENVDGLPEFVERGVGVIAIRSIGNTDWSWLDTLPGCTSGIRVYSIVLMAAGADTIVLRSNSVSGPVWFKYVTTAAEYAVLPIGGVLCQPVLKASDQTADSDSMITIVYEKA